jgi:hypothetical protein
MGKCFFGPLKSHFKNEPAACIEQNSQTEIARYHMERLSGFAWNKAASVGVDVSAFESTGTYTLNGNRVLEYFFSISGTSGNVNFMETVSPLLQESTPKMCYLSQQDFH